MMKEFWNERYNSSVFAYGTDPNQYFKESIDNLSPGSLLLPGEGEGRNAVYAAKQGWHVDAFDYSEVAKQKALKLASDRNVTINYQLKNTDDFSSSITYDVVALIYLHLPSHLRIDFYNRLFYMIKPNGFILLEGFASDQIYNSSGGPKNPDLLFSTEQLETEFSKFQIIKLQNITRLLYEGEYHSGKASVVQMLAKKKISSL